MIKCKEKFDIFNIGLLSINYLGLMFIIPGLLYYFGIAGTFINGNMIWVNQKGVIYSWLFIITFGLSFIIFKFKKNIGEIYWNNRRVILIIFALISTGMLIKIYRLINGSYQTYIYANLNSPIFIYQYLISLNIFFYLALAVSFIHYYQLLNISDKNSNKFKYISWFQFIVYLSLTMLTSGSKFYVVFIFLIPIISRYYIINDIKNKYLLITAISISLLFPVKNIFKDLTIASNYFNIDVIVNTKWNERGVLNYLFHSNEAVILIKEPNLKRENRILDFYLDNTIGRINQLHVFSIIINKTNGNYLNGNTFLDFFSAIGFSSSITSKYIKQNEGVNFPTSSGLANDNLTGIGNTNIGDMYQNFGLGGIIIYGIFLGFALKLFYSKFKTSKNPSLLLYYIFLTPIILHAYEQSLSSSFAHILKLIILIYFINIILNAKKFPSFS